MDIYGREYWTDTKGIAGKIKTFPEDFVVEEIGTKVKYRLLEKFQDWLPDFLLKKNAQLHCTLVKTNYTTHRAVGQIAKKLGISRKRIGYAGIKDKRAISSQRISIFGAERKRVKRLRIKDIVLKDFSYSKKRIDIGDLQGNIFTIVIRDHKGTQKEIEKFVNDAKILPNYFGEQRFGVRRPINYRIGRNILLGNLEKAARILLTETGDESKEATEARKALGNNWNESGFKTALKNFPDYLGIEKNFLNHLVRYPKDYAGAFRRIPKRLRILFTYSLQSYIFNRTLSRMKNKTPKSLPLVGFMTKELPKEMIEEMEKIKIKKDDFKCKTMPEMSSKGSKRESTIEVENIRLVSFDRNTVKIKFTLKKGSYATVVLDELMKNQLYKKESSS